MASTVPGPGVTAGGVPYPNLADPAVANRFAQTAVAGGNPYFQGPGSPQASPQGAGDAARAGQWLQDHPAVPPPAAPPGEPAHPALPNPDQQYVDQFMGSIGRQRQAIDNQLAASTQQLGARRDAAAAVVAGLPANFRTHFAAATKNSALEQHVAAGNARGNDRALGANANNQLAHATLENTNAAAQSTVPLMNEGVTANYGQGLDTLNAAHTSAEGQLDAQVAQFQASQAAAATQANASRASQRESERFQNSQRVAQDQYDLYKTSLTHGANGGVSADYAANPGHQVIDLPGYGRVTQDQAQSLIGTQKYTSLDGYLYAAQHGPTLANGIKQAMSKGDSKAAQAIWNAQSPDTHNFLFRQFGLNPAAVGITS